MVEPITLLCSFFEHQNRIVEDVAEHSLVDKITGAFAIVSVVERLFVNWVPYVVVVHRREPGTERVEQPNGGR